MDSEYILLQQLTEKSDVYSFGVVLFVILRARPVMDTSLLEEQVNLVEWVVHCQKISILDQMTGPYLKGKIAAECFKQYVVTAMKCVANQGRDRPSMAEVLWKLELSLQLQASAEEINEGIVKMHIEEETFHPMHGRKILMYPQVMMIVEAHFLEKSHVRSLMLAIFGLGFFSKQV